MIRQSSIAPLVRKVLRPFDVVLIRIMSELLSKLYYDPKTGYVGARALYEKARELDPEVTFKIVKDWYASQTDIRRFQEQKKRFDGFK